MIETQDDVTNREQTSELPLTVISQTKRREQGKSS